MKIFILLLALAITGQAQNHQATAQFLAGMPLAGTGLDNFAQVPAWQKHAKQMDYAWNQSELRQMQKIRAWAPLNLGEIHGSQSPVFYFFSGPDILYAQALFPNAGTYVLCAKEPVGGVVDPAQVPPEELNNAVGSSRVDLQACKLEYSIVSPK